MLLQNMRLSDTLATRRKSALGQKRSFNANRRNVCFRGNSVAKLFSGCRIVIIESLYQMKRIILTEIGTATNQCYAKFPWTEFCNRITSEADISTEIQSNDFRRPLDIRLRGQKGRKTQMQEGPGLARSGHSARPVPLALGQ